MSRPPADPLDIRKRKARFRAWHRGMREADLVIGGFADKHLAGFDESQLGLFETLLGESDGDIVKWITGEKQVPPHQDNDVVRRMISDARSLAT
jgi:antitoxin CptB